MFVILLLAAGEGRRYREAGGEGYKLLAEVAPSRTVVRQSCEAMLTVGWPVHVVTGQDDAAIRGKLHGLPVHYVPNREASLGIGSSMRCGVTGTAHAKGWLIGLADMPFIRPDSIARVARSLEAGAPITYPVYQGKRGHPVGFSQLSYPELVALPSGAGGNRILSARASDCVAVPVDDPGILRDIDVPGDLHREAAT